MAYQVGFVDAGFLKAGGCKTLDRKRRQTEVKPAAVVDWLKKLGPFLRLYWYDGAFDPADSRYAAQRRYFDGIALTPGVSLRLGHLVERRPEWEYSLRKALEKCGVDSVEFEKHFQVRPEISQKGVDSLIVLDLVRFAQQGSFDTAVLVAGDRDLAEAVRAVQDLGRRVIIAKPQAAGIATELRQLADELIVLGKSDLEKMLVKSERPELEAVPELEDSASSP